METHLVPSQTVTILAFHNNSNARVYKPTKYIMKLLSEWGISCKKCLFSQILKLLSS